MDIKQKIALTVVAAPCVTYLLRGFGPLLAIGAGLGATAITLRAVLTRQEWQLIVGGSRAAGAVEDLIGAISG